LPYLTEDFTERIGYYSFRDEKLLFVNVERDFGRVAPLCEAALAYSGFEDCSYLDISRTKSKTILHRINLALYDFFKGGYMPHRISKILSAQGINVISNFEEFASRSDEARFTSAERKLLLKALRNENFHSSLDAEHFINELEAKSVEALKIVNVLESVIKRLKINRTFVWNGRFFNSTLVEIASIRGGAICSKIEFGAFVDKSFEICRDSASSLLDHSRRYFSHLGIDDRTKPMKNIDQYLLSRSSNPYTKSFEQINTSDLPNVEFFTFYLTSYLETVLEDVPGIPTQEDCVLICARELESKGLKLLLRLHPNPQAPAYELLETEYWKKFVDENNITNCEIVDANSKFDSYQLASFSLGSLCYVSTIGLELNSRGWPCFYLIKQPWDSDFGTPESEESLKFKLGAFISNPSVISDERANGYINFLQNYGFKYTYLEKYGEKIYFRKKQFMKERRNDNLLLKFPLKLKKVLRNLISYLRNNLKLF
jgi:hypothetical protein